MRHSPPRILSSLLLLVLFLTACSATGFVYNRADWLIKRQLGNYLEDLTRAQQQHLDTVLDHYMAWHRDSEMPRYRDYLLSLKQDIQKPLSAELIDRRMEQGFVLWQSLLDRAMPDMVAVLQGLSDKQVEQLLVNISEQQRRPWGDAEPDDDKAVAEERRANVERSLRRWIGRLSERQLALLDEWAAKVHNSYPLAIEQQQLWQQKFASALAEREDTGLFTERLRLLFIETDTLWPEAYRYQLQENRQYSTQLLIDIHSTLSERQQARLQKRLAGYVRDIDRIID